MHIDCSDFDHLRFLRFVLFVLILASAVILTLTYNPYGQSPVYWYPLAVLVVFPMIWSGIRLSTLIRDSYPTWEKPVREGLNECHILIVCPDWDPLIKLANLVSESFWTHGICCCLHKREEIKCKLIGNDPSGTDLNLAEALALLPSLDSYLVLVLKACNFNPDHLTAAQFDLLNRGGQSVLFSDRSKEHRLLGKKPRKSPGQRDADAIVDRLIDNTKMIMRIVEAA